MTRALSMLVLVGALLACAPAHRHVRGWSAGEPMGELAPCLAPEGDEEAWRRSAPLGLRSAVSATLVAPEVARWRLADTMVREGREEPGPHERASWTTWFGERGDRLTCLVRWEFDRLFQLERVTDPRVGWTFRLSDDRGRQVEPRALLDVALDRTERHHVADFRLTFPLRDRSGRPLLDAFTSRLDLEVSGGPGKARLSWRFRPEIGTPGGP